MTSRAPSLRDDSADADAVSGGKAQIVSPDEFQDRFAQTVRLHCRRKRLTIGQLAVDAGIAEKRLRKLIDNDPDDRRQATGSELLSIWCVLGRGAASRDLAIINLSADDADEPDDARLGELVADGCGAMAALAGIAVDGKIDAAEAETADRTADTLEATAAKLRSQARKARGR
jgi:hypothetical protein